MPRRNNPAIFPMSWAEAFEYVVQLNRSRHHGLDNRLLPSRREILFAYYPPVCQSGLVTYGTCIEPSRIVRLKFKYADNSKRFFDELLERYKVNLGKPDEWRGDPFNIVIAWKWSFTDKDGNNISLILQHNTRDEEEKQGNSVKMTMWNLMLDEDRCFEQKHPEAGGSPSFTFSDPDSIDWKPLVPR